MTNLSQLNLGSNTQVVFQSQTNPIVEPLDGPTSVSQSMERFPDTLYNKGTDSHLYKFLTALCSDSGAGMLKKYTLLARLRTEGPLLIWHNLDSTYANVFDFPRLPSEIYKYDPSSMALEKQVWDKINASDAAYRRRISDFFQAVRLGNSPLGLALCAKAGSGEDVDFSENYRYIFDQISDNPLGLDRDGDTSSTSEFIISPRVLDTTQTNSITINLTPSASGQFQIVYDRVPSVPIDQTVTAAQLQTVLTSISLFDSSTLTVTSPQPNQFIVNIKDKSVSPFLFTTIVSAAMSSSGGKVDIVYPLKDSFYISKFVGPTAEWYEENYDALSLPTFNDNIRAGNMLNRSGIFLDPTIERNMVAMLDHIRPTNTLMNVKPITERYLNVAARTVTASSEQAHITRFVTGNPGVVWPPTDPTTGLFIQGSITTTLPTNNSAQVSVENESTFYNYSNYAIPVIYHTIEGAIAYTNEALADQTYNTADFYTLGYPFYKSEHAGLFQESVVLTWYKFLGNITSSDAFPASQAIAANSTPLIVNGNAANPNSPALVNSYYPSDYFTLPGVDTQNHPSELWWSSKERVPLVNGNLTSEVLEIDYGKLRTVNYMAFDIMRKPINIKIEYDARTFDDGTHSWVEIQPLPFAKFDNVIFFNATQNPWEHVEFYFNDANGQPVASRYFRITFTRRQEVWPSPQHVATVWSIDVANLRTARFIVDLNDTRGYLTGINTLTGSQDLNQIGGFRQAFVMPESYIRGENGGFLEPRDPVITPVIPDIMGFGFLANITEPDYTFDWQLFDVTGDFPLLIKGGSEERSSSAFTGQTWIDVFFEPTEFIATAQDSRFEFRVFNYNHIDTIYMQTPNPLTDSTYSNGYIETLPDGGGVAQIIEQSNTGIVFRVWADIGESGRDVLGNFYREGVRIDTADNVLDFEEFTSWYSRPCPSPEGVEALYFDVRQEDANGGLVPSIIDAVKINPSMYGPFMNIYYSVESSQGPAPQRIEDWDNILWTPVSQTYVLSANRSFDLPQPVKAAWICLEFTNLQPIPYPLPDYPELPPISFKEMPQWVVDDMAVNSTYNGNPLQQNSQFLQNNTSVPVDVLGLYKITAEFILNNRNNLAAISSSTINSEAAEGVDPFTLSQINLLTPQMFAGNLAATTDTSTLLGNQVAQNNSVSAANSNAEFIANPTANSSAPIAVSTVDDRTQTSYSYLASTPLFFDRICRHNYSNVTARYNKKAYCVGLNGVQFRRNDFTVSHDDDAIYDQLADANLETSPLIEFNTWIATPSTRIGVGQSVFVSYTINNNRFLNEPLVFNLSSSPDIAPVTLRNSGGRATNLIVTQFANGSGEQYVLGQDFDVIYDPNSKSNALIRTSSHIHLVVAPNQERVEIGIVVGYAVPSAAESTGTVGELGVISGVANITSTDLYVKAGAITYSDSAIAIGASLPSGEDIYSSPGDSDTVTGTTVLTYTEIYGQASGTTYADASIVIVGGGSASAAEVTSYTPEATTVTGAMNQAAVAASDEVYIHSSTTYIDAATVGGIHAISDAQVQTYADEATTITGHMDVTVVQTQSQEVFTPALGTSYSDAGFYQAHSAASPDTDTTNQIEIYSRAYVDSATIVSNVSSATDISAFEVYNVANTVDDIIDFPLFEEANQVITPVVRQAIFYPFEPDVPLAVVAAMRTHISTAAGAGVTVSFALYSYDYTAAGQFAATLAYQSPFVACPTTADTVVQASLTNAPAILDFTQNKYMVAIAFDGTGAMPGVAAMPATNLGIVTFTPAATPPAGAYAWPATLNQTMVTSYSNYPYIAVVTSDGTEYI